MFGEASPLQLSGDPVIAKVILDLPVSQPLDYLMPVLVPVGSLCPVPVGRRQHIGIVVAHAHTSALDPARLKPLGQPLEGLQLSPSWLALSRFAADYYHSPWGEIALPVLPPSLRRIPGKRKTKAKLSPDAARDPMAATDTVQIPTDIPPQRNPEQMAAIEAIIQAKGFMPFCLFGITGSGKTEVYLGAIEQLLRTDVSPDDAPSQVLVLVPEINLTPQLHARLQARFPNLPVVSLHSAMPPAQRAAAWMSAHRGEARIILGTRTAIFASLPRLRLIVVDEEHDASFKAHGGVPYSARDLAVKRAHMEGIAVVLGSATPSLETWQAVTAGRYHALRLTQRASANAVLPHIDTIDLNTSALESGFTQPLRQAISATLARGEQSLIFLNRRGFAPVLRCPACEWHTHCPHCDSFAAYHRVGLCLRCHHCGWQARVPAVCPDCGNQDLQPVGQGTQRVEETLAQFWPEARILRIDRDSAQGVRGASRTDAALQAVHEGQVDILVGTQMITKGHDFRRVSLVGVLNADAQLVAADFRAPERLFAVLMQVAGRAGRAGQDSRVMIQTRYPAHPLFAALKRADFAGFARSQIEERRSAHMPPFVHHALLNCAARSMEQALAFLAECAALHEQLPSAAAVTAYDPVPMPLARMASESRAQLLLESSNRPALHAFLDAWLPLVQARGQRGILRWSLDVDPQSI